MLPVDAILLYSGLPPQVLPENTTASDRSIFEAYLNDPIPRMHIKQMPAFRVKSDGVLFRNGRILHEGSPYYFQPEHPVNTQSYLPHIRKRLFRRVFRYYCIDNAISIKTPCAWLTDTFSQHYFHWVVETLPRLFLWTLVDTGNRPVVLAKKLLRYAYVRQSLEWFRNRNFIFLEDGQLYRFTKATYLSPMGKPYQFNAPLLQAFNAFIRAALPVRTALPLRKVYINRAGSKKRIASNGAEVDAVFREHGFEIVHMEDLDLLQQAQLAGSCAVIAGIHGAGLANMIFAPPGNRVLELQQNMGWPSVYYRMANALGNPYYYQFCPTTDNQPQGANINANITINLAQLEQVLQQVQA